MNHYCHSDGTCSEKPKNKQADMPDTDTSTARPCTRSNKIVIEKDCWCKIEVRVKRFSTCRKGSYCWLDETCNSKQKEGKVLYVLSLKTELTGVDPDDFNKNTNMIQAFKDTVAKLLDDVSPEDVYDVVAKSASRRSLSTFSLRQLGANDKALIWYQVKFSSKQSAEASKTSLENNNGLFAQELIVQMKSNNVQDISTDSIKTEMKEIDLNEQSEADVNSAVKESKENEEQKRKDGASSNDNEANANSDGGGGDGGVVGLVIGLLVLFCCVLCSIYYCKYGSIKSANVTNEEDGDAVVVSSDVSGVQVEMIQSPMSKARNLNNKNARYEVEVEIEIESELPQLHHLLNDLRLKDWINKFVLHGIHTTEILLNEVTENDLRVIGLRSLQIRKLQKRMDELKCVVASSVPNVTEEEENVNSEPAKKKWKRRFSVATHLEYYGASSTCSPPPFFPFFFFFFFFSLLNF